ncbi:carbohydrate-binding protein [Hymenobacter algoricola]|uniref:Carbohydrate-binding protein n=1 Tax=Hymenobacter algoricola TaxID=486267 RepID=A0ABP7MPC2_9BACT
MKKTLTQLLGALAIMAGSGAQAQAQTYQLVWADEFNGSLNPAWQFETGGGGWGNNEKQFYQAANAAVVNGELQITARKQAVGGLPYTSARLKTQGRQEFTFGKIEARIKLPLGQGLWPAFWMLGGNISTVGWPRCGEIDVMEQVNADSRTYGTVHWDSNGHAQYSGNTAMSANTYHVYGIEWDASAIRWFLDGVKFHEITIAGGVGGTEEFQKPFFLLLNLAVAGDWPGQAVDESRLPATMAVDYVRVYQKTSTPPPASTLIQAEAYSAMSGVQLENCADSGGGQDVGWIDAGDWMAYNNISFPTSGAYTVEYRVASPGGGRVSCDLNGGATQLGSVAIPATGGWQSWTTVAQTVNVNAGTYNFGTYAPAGGWNLNWIRITKQGAARTALATANGLAGPTSLEVYPNPVTSQLQLSGAAAVAGAEVRIRDVTGRQVWQGVYRGGAVPVADLRAGLYTLEVRQGGQLRRQRFVKE